MPENYDLGGVAELNEKKVADLKATKRAALPFFVFALILGLIPIIGWFFFGPILFLMGLWYLFVLSRTHYTLTDKRLIKGRSIARTIGEEIAIADIANVQIHKPIWGKIFGYGAVTVIPVSGRFGVGPDMSVTKLGKKRSVTTEQGKALSKIILRKPEEFAQVIQRLRLATPGQSR
ncbi:MAG TPA: PH domain-containing protein [Candidatus Bathyarchaeia archaeon]|nr:PH domain-containing protein [Candidatus Bathyarchaeia archaeon]